VIRFVNNENYPVTFNLFKQQTAYTSPGPGTPEKTLKDATARETTADNELNYRMQFWIESSKAANFSALKTKIYTNLYQNLADPLQPAGSNYVVRFKSPVKQSNVSLSGARLLDNAAEDRIYDAEVIIYQSDAFTINADGSGTFNISDDKKLASLTGSLLD
jgi:hypothetical protein